MTHKKNIMAATVIIQTMSAVDIMKSSQPPAGQKFGIISIVGPYARQKAKLFGLKLYGVADDEDEARQLASYYNRQDPAFDVYIIPLGEWGPLEFSPDDIEEQIFGDKFLTEMIQQRKQQHEKNLSQWETELAERRKAVKDEWKAHAQGDTPKSSAVEVLGRIKQMETTHRSLKEELESLYRQYHNSFTDEEKRLAESLPIPVAEPIAPTTCEIEPVQEA